MITVNPDQFRTLAASETQEFLRVGPLADCVALVAATPSRGATAIGAWHVNGGTLDGTAAAQACLAQLEGFIANTTADWVVCFGTNHQSDTARSKFREAIKSMLDSTSSLNGQTVSYYGGNELDIDGSGVVLNATALTHYPAAR